MNKPPPGTRTVHIKRDGTKKDDPISSGDETLPSGWTPRRAAEVGGRGRRDGPGGGGGKDGKAETQEDCLSRVHAELEVRTGGHVQGSDWSICLKEQYGTDLVQYSYWSIYL